ncbi:MAG TPA: hypothetical protein ENI07_20035 [Desulfobacterales bacterium]|nr:hypothetical protein [Desulfobacterales bacterium]
MDLKQLLRPFKENDIEWRIQSSGMKDNRPWGMCLAYVTNRAIMERLDEICGPENWKNEFTKGPDGGVLCGISIFSESAVSDWITKWDGAENTQFEPVKGGLSSAMKRAAVQWGIGRYLYNLDATWANFSEGGRLKAKVENRWLKWDPPELPSWALPDGSGKPDPEKSCQEAKLKPEPKKRDYAGASGKEKSQPGSMEKDYSKGKYTGHRTGGARPSSGKTLSALSGKNKGPMPATTQQDKAFDQSCKAKGLSDPEKAAFKQFALSNHDGVESHESIGDLISHFESYLDNFIKSGVYNPDKKQGE